jgi:hypothetical protein
VTYSIADASGNVVIFSDSIRVVHDQSLKKGLDLLSRSGSTPESFELMQNSPNPFNPSTEIVYAVPEQGRVLLSVYNITGKRIKTLIDAEESIGYHTVRWNGRNDSGEMVSGGMYLCRMEAGVYRQTIRMLLIK